MRTGILSGNYDEYAGWVDDNTDPYEMADFFYIESVVDLFEKRGVNVKRVGTWQERRDLYEIYDYVAHDGGMNGMTLDGRYINDHNFADEMGDDVMIPLNSYVRDKSIIFRTWRPGERPVGVLSWKDGYFEFKGDAKESAEVFFDELRHVAQDIIDDKYVKRTQTLEEHMTVQKEKDERLKLLEELVRASIKTFVQEYKIEELETPLSYTVDRLIHECSEVFIRVSGLHKDYE